MRRLAWRDPRLRLRSFVTAACLVAGVAGCGGWRDEGRSFPSPDGAFTLVTSVNADRADRARYLCLKVRVVDKERKVQHEELTPASVRLAWDVVWRGSRRVVLDSADVGTLVWAQGSDGGWRSVPCAAGDPVLPAHTGRCGPKP